METIRIELTVYVKTALSIGTSRRTPVRNGNQALIIPGSQVKGQLRHQLEQLFDALGVAIYDTVHLPDEVADPISQIFGSPYHSSPFKFNDLLCDERTSNRTEFRIGVAIDRRRRALVNETFHITETSVSGEKIVFRNPEAILGDLPTDRAENYTRWLLAALQQITEIGGGKSRGLGWVKIKAKAFCGEKRITLNELEVPQ